MRLTYSLSLTPERSVHASVCGLEVQSVKRDLLTWKETYKRGLLTLSLWYLIAACVGVECSKRDLCVWKETYVCEKSHIKEAYFLSLFLISHRCVHASVKYAAGTCGICRKRPIYMKRDLFPWKETSKREKRPKNVSLWYLIAAVRCRMCRKRPIYMKRDLFTWKETHKRLSLKSGRCVQYSVCCHQVRSVAKETYVSEKRHVKETYWLSHSLIPDRDL